MPKLTSDKILAQTREYLVGMFLVPWVWIWGFFVILLGTYLLGLIRGTFTGAETFRFSSDFVNLLIVWLTTFVILIGNYSIYHFGRYAYPRLKPVLFIISVLVALVFLTIYFPFLIEVISLD
jgi:hypothetical protein